MKAILGVVAVSETPPTQSCEAPGERFQYIELTRPVSRCQHALPTPTGDSGGAVRWRSLFCTRGIQPCRHAQRVSLGVTQSTPRMHAMHVTASTLFASWISLCPATASVCFGEQMRVSVNVLGVRVCRLVGSYSLALVPNELTYVLATVYAGRPTVISMVPLSASIPTATASLLSRQGLANRQG